MASKKLTRSRDHRMLSGVAGGIADYFGIDSNLVRLVFCVLALVTSGGGVIAYLIGWLLLPDEYDDVRGFGLGLAYVSSVIRQCGGRIQPESVVGVGTKMVILLPTVKEG